MSEQMRPSLPHWVKVLLALLVLVVAIQGIFLYRMKAGLDQANLVGKEVAGSSVRKPDPTSGSASYGPTWEEDPFIDETWDPFDEMQRIREQMDRLFGEAFGRFERSSRFGDLFEPFTFSPHVDLRETADAFEVTVDLPGAEKSTIKTTLKGQVLTIVAETDARVDERNEEEGSIVLRRERRVGRFERSITLPEPVDPSDMTSTFEDGVLTVRIHKARKEGQ